MPIRSASKDGTLCGHLNCKLILLLEASYKDSSMHERGGVHLLVSKQNNKASDTVALLTGRRSGVAGWGADLGNQA